MANPEAPIYIRQPEKHRKPSVFIGEVPFEGSHTIAVVEGTLPTASEIKKSVRRSRRSFLLKTAGLAVVPLGLLVAKIK